MEQFQKGHCTCTLFFWAELISVGIYGSGIQVRSSPDHCNGTDSQYETTQLEKAVINVHLGQKFARWLTTA